MSDAEAQEYFLPSLRHGGRSAKIQTIIPYVIWRGMNQIHPAARTLAGGLSGVIAAHRTHPCCLFLLGLLFSGRRLKERDRDASRHQQEHSAQSYFQPGEP